MTLAAPLCIDSGDGKTRGKAISLGRLGWVCVGALDRAFRGKLLSIEGVSAEASNMEWFLSTKILAQKGLATRPSGQ
jgi:hypothetical protein